MANAELGELLNLFARDDDNDNDDDGDDNAGGRGRLFWYITLF